MERTYVNGTPISWKIVYIRSEQKRFSDVQAKGSGCMHMKQTSSAIVPGAWWDRYTVWPIIILCLIMYFDTLDQYWFIKMLDGYVIKIWLPPVLMFSAFYCRRLVQGRLKYPVRNTTPLTMMIGAYIFAGSLSLLFHETPYYIGKYGLMMFAPFTLYFVIVYGFRDNRNIESLVKLLFVFGVIYSLFSLFLFYYVGAEAWQIETIQKKFMLSDSTAAFNPNTHATFYSDKLKEYIIRVGPPGIDEPKFGAMLGPLVLAGIYYAMNSTHRIYRVLYSAGAILLTISVFATLARSSIGALFAGLLCFFLIQKNKISGIATGLLVFILVVVIMISVPGALDRILQLMGNFSFLAEMEMVDELIKDREVYMRVDGHVESYGVGFRLLRDAPFGGLLGIGMTEFDNIFGPGNRFTVPHSRYMKILDTAGSLALIPYIGFIVLLMYISWRTIKEEDKLINGNDLGRVLLSAVVLLAVRLNNQGMESYYYWIFFGLMAAWIRNSAYRGTR